MSAVGMLQRIAFDWGVRCFGAEHMHNVALRGIRCAEEAIELGQAAGVPRDMMHKLVEQVYDRPVGEIEQEIGGTLVTTAVMCEQRGASMANLFEREVTRVLAKSPEHFANRNRQKMSLDILKTGPRCISCGELLSMHPTPRCAGFNRI